ncbi:MAG: S41 family peptidase, partial [Candidatus Izemoplasmatales bacterium]|nr:S41 family peptidase [Candidatus Izemoplasmatales bacterium]
ACNGGGVLAGVFHLLNYITNEDISLYTTTLGAKSSSTYDVEGDKAIDAKWYFITSGATYSAANLVTAMAKELDLVETIGARSGGGACSVKALVLPNGAVMQMSSNMNLSYSDYSTVEEGVDTDYPIDFYSAGMRYYNTGVRARYPDEETFYGIILEMNEEEPAE